VAGFCKHGNEALDSIKNWKFPVRLSDYQLLKNNSALWDESTD